MDIKVGDWVKSLITVNDVRAGKDYLVVSTSYLPYVDVIDDAGDEYTLTAREYEVQTKPEDIPDVGDNVYTLNISLQGTGTFFTKTKDIVLPTGADLIELISKLNEL